MRIMLGLGPLLLLATLLAPGAVAQPTFPPGSAIGLSPPPGFVASSRFTGFENAATGGSIVLAELPVDESAALRDGLTPDRLATQGVLEQGRTTLTVAGRDGLLIRGIQRAQGLTVAKRILVVRGEGFTAVVTANLPEAAPGDLAAVETALASLELRSSDADAARNALPFRFTEGRVFRLSRTLLNAALLSPEDDASLGPVTPQLVIAASLGATPVGDRATLAERALRTLPGLQGLTLEPATVVPFAGTDAVLLRGRATDASTGGPVRVAQWLAIPPAGGTLRMIGTAPAERWDALWPEFQAVAASVRPR